MYFKKIKEFYRDKPIRRLFKNSGILLTGNIGASALGMLSLALTARALGADRLGLLVLITTYVLVVDRIINFQSWQALIKFGAEALSMDRKGDFNSILKFAFFLDVGTAISGSLIAASGSWIIGDFLDWNSDTVLMASAYSATILFHISGAPTGILHIFERFQLFSLITVAAAAIKLIGVSLAFFTEADLWVFVLVWGITDIFGNILLLGLALRELKRKSYGSLRHSSIDNISLRFPGIWRFVITTNLNASIRMTSREADVFVIGVLLSPASVGLYKIGKQVASVLGMLTDPLYQTIYPALSKLHAESNKRDFIKLARGSAFIAGSAAVTFYILLLLLANPLLVHVFGPEFVEAKSVMLWYAAAVVLAVASFPLSPMIIARGKPQILMWILVGSTAAYFMTLPLLIAAYEIDGAGIAYVCFYMCWIFASLAFIVRDMKND